MSGAGRSTALNAFEDLGFFCVDNLPPSLVGHMLDLVGQGGDIQRVALGMDVRTGAFIEGAEEVLAGLSEVGHDVGVLFLDSTEEALVKRFSETRRTHPMATAGNVLDAVRRERERLGSLRARADLIVDTTDLSVHDLRRVIVDHVARGGAKRTMMTRVVSFGFKYGIPVNADLVFDLRYMPNPHFVPELRPRTGQDPEVASFVLETDEARELLEGLVPLLEKLLPRYQREGKSYLTIAVGCTGGKHRSVAVAEALAERLSSGRELIVQHRDSERSRS
jgi:UPF0042 nucleotide-binding protein